MWGWGRTSSPCPERNTAGPIWSKKMKGPTIRRRIDGKARRTSNPSPRSRVRGRMTVSIGDAGSRSSNGSSGVRQVISPPGGTMPRADTGFYPDVDPLRSLPRQRLRGFLPDGIAKEEEDRHVDAAARLLDVPEERREDAMAVEEELGEVHARFKDVGVRRLLQRTSRRGARSRPGGSR